MILMAAVWQDNARSLSCAKILKVEKFINMAHVSFVKWPSGHAQSFDGFECVNSTLRLYRSVQKYATTKTSHFKAKFANISRFIHKQKHWHQILQWPTANKVEGFEGSTVCLKNIAHFFYLGGHIEEIYPHIYRSSQITWPRPMSK